MRTRADRRHHRERIKHRVEEYNELRWIKTYDKDWYKQAVVSRTETRKPCSCDMCCNPRHSKLLKCERLTMQERRQFQRDKWE